MRLCSGNTNRIFIEPLHWETVSIFFKLQKNARDLALSKKAQKMFLGKSILIDYTKHC